MNQCNCKRPDYEVMEAMRQPNKRGFYIEEKEKKMYIKINNEKNCYKFINKMIWKENNTHRTEQQTIYVTENCCTHFYCIRVGYGGK